MRRFRMRRTLHGHGHSGMLEPNPIPYRALMIVKGSDNKLRNFGARVGRFCQIAEPFQYSYELWRRSGTHWKRFSIKLRRFCTIAEPF